MSASTCSTDIVANFVAHPEKSYKEFVHQCNELAESTLLARSIALFLASRSSPESQEVRRQLLNMHGSETPQWEDLIGARLHADLNYPSFVCNIDIFDDDRHSYPAIVKDSHISPSNESKTEISEILTYLFDVFTATAKTVGLAGNFWTLQAPFRQRSLFHFFHIKDRCRSISTAKSDLRRMPFFIRQERVKLLYAYCVDMKVKAISKFVIDKIDELTTTYNDNDDINDDSSSTSSSSSLSAPTTPTETKNKSAKLLPKKRCRVDPSQEPSRDQIPLLVDLINADEAFLIAIRKLRLLDEQGPSTNHSFSILLEK